MVMPQVLDVSGRHAVNTRQHLEVALRYWLDNLLRAERGKGKRISERVLSFLQTVKVMQCTKLWDRQRLQIEISIYHIRKAWRPLLSQ